MHPYRARGRAGHWPCAQHRRGHRGGLLALARGFRAAPGSRGCGECERRRRPWTPCRCLRRPTCRWYICCPASARGPGPPVSVGALRWDWGLAAGNTERGLVGIAVRLWPLLQQGRSLCVCKLGCVG